MIVEAIAKAPQPLWREKAERWLKAVGTPEPATSIDHPDDNTDPDPPRGAPAARVWPRVFPGL
jgi:hypothetical protein